MYNHQKASCISYIHHADADLTGTYSPLESVIVLGNEVAQGEERVRGVQYKMKGGWGDEWDSQAWRKEERRRWRETKDIMVVRKAA